jgi:mono/diheme cytochrome c family protein
MGCSTTPSRVRIAALASLAAGIAVHDPSTAAPPAQPAARISFDRDIRPILSDNCFACHGPDGAKRQAGLRLDVADSAHGELESGSRAIVPEDVAASELVARIVSDDPDSVMPPPEAKIGRLTAEQVELLRRWIVEGAKYEPHWAFVAPLKPDVKPGAEPATAAIDGAVAAKLAKRGLELQPEADRGTLIRRATFDITGLPPTPAEVEAFSADTSPDAYERLLDRLLASPRYGERMAADWMDLARYSDSYGFQVDRERPTMWPWRDWVISAFNRNLPWDQFAVWQIAGDLLPGATEEQLLATAFNRLHQQECEGGSVEEEYRVNSVNDRVTTFGTAFLGLTFECCRCHDHKFDPLTQQEFYQLFAFFDDIDEAGLYSFFTQAVPTPKLRVLDERMATAIAKADEACGEAATELDRCEAAARTAVADWIAGKAGMPRALAGAQAGAIPGELVHYAFDQRGADGRFASLADTLGDNSGRSGDDASPPEEKRGDEPRDRSARSPVENTLVAGRFGQAIRLTGDHPVETPVGDFRRSHPFTVSLWLKSPDVKQRAVVFHRSTAWTDAGSRGYELLIADGHLRWSLVHFWPGDAVSVRSAEALPVGEWVHVAVSSDGSGRAAGLEMFVNGHPAATEIVRDSLTREILNDGRDDPDESVDKRIAPGRTIRIGERMRDSGFKDGLVDDFRVFDRALSPLEVRETFAPGTIRAAIKAALAAGQEAETLGDYVASAFDEAAAAQRSALEEARLARDELAEKPLEIMVMRELPQPRTASVLTRGEYDKRGQAVEPGTPAMLPPFPDDQPRNRLGLARWLVDPDHPLLARVTVNRLWQALFGLGLVQSPEDLGSQSTRPEHLEVLDLLAWTFSHPVGDGGIGWDMKALVKTVMLSRTYRQRSSAEGKTMADDPLNLWLARGPRHRLPAEMIRDGALAACGLLVDKIGGPPVKTYDIEESFKPAAADTGEALYRRSLYTFWRRTGPAPVLESFDVPKRVVCVAKRDATNTPLHAFVLMNGPQFVEAARVLAGKLLAEHDGQAERVLDRAFSLLTSRQPDDEERRIVRRMHAEQLEWYRGHPDDAARLVAVGDTKPDAALAAVDVAAAAGVINALMNYDGCVVKR